jgi:mono/diheme cytochrome c family protein
VEALCPSIPRRLYVQPYCSLHRIFTIGLRDDDAGDSAGVPAARGPSSAGAGAGPPDKSFTGEAMPMRGWTTMNDEDVKAVAAYVWSISHPPQPPAPDRRRLRGG